MDTATQTHFTKTGCPHNWTEEPKNCQCRKNPSSTVRFSIACSALSRASSLSRGSYMMLLCLLVARHLYSRQRTCLFIFPSIVSVLPRWITNFFNHFSVSFCSTRSSFASYLLSPLCVFSAFHFFLLSSHHYANIGRHPFCPDISIMKLSFSLSELTTECSDSLKTDIRASTLLHTVSSCFNL